MVRFELMERSILDKGAQIHSFYATPKLSLEGFIEQKSYYGVEYNFSNGEVFFTLGESVFSKADFITKFQIV